MRRAARQPASAQQVGAEISLLSRRKKLLFGSVIVVGTLTLIEVVLTLAGVGTLSAGDDRYLGFAGGSTLFVHDCWFSGGPARSCSRPWSAA